MLRLPFFSRKKPQRRPLHEIEMQITDGLERIHLRCTLLGEVFLAADDLMKHLKEYQGEPVRRARLQAALDSYRAFPGRASGL